MSVHVSQREQSDLAFLLRLKDICSYINFFVGVRSVEVNESVHHKSASPSLSKGKSKRREFRNVYAEDLCHLGFDAYNSACQANDIFISKEFPREDFLTRRKLFQRAHTDVCAIPRMTEIYLETLCQYNSIKPKNAYKALQKVSNDCNFVKSCITSIIKKDLDKASKFQRQRVAAIIKAAKDKEINNIDLIVDKLTEDEKEVYVNIKGEDPDKILGTDKKKGTTKQDRIREERKKHRTERKKLYQEAKDKGLRIQKPFVKMAKGEKPEEVDIEAFKKKVTSGEIFSNYVAPLENKNESQIDLDAVVHPNFSISERNIININ